MWSSSVLILGEEKIQAGVRRVATEDHLLMCRSYEVLQNAKINTSHILLALPFFVSVFSACLKKKSQKTVLLFWLVLIGLTFIHRNITLWRHWVRSVLFEAKSDFASGIEARLCWQRTRNELKAVGFGQASDQILGDELYGEKGSEIFHFHFPVSGQTFGVFTAG